MVSCGRGPLKVLLAPLFASLDTLPASVDGNVRQCSLPTTQGHLPTSMGWAKYHCLIVGGMLGGDSMWHLKCVPENVAML
jgi:hypothetical protein